MDNHALQIQNEYFGFLDDEVIQNVNHREVLKMIEANGQRIVIDIDSLRKFSIHRADQLIVNYVYEEISFKHALKAYISLVDAAYSCKFDEFFIGIKGCFGTRYVTPRTINSKLLGNLVCLEGVVQSCSQVESILVKSVHYCPATKNTIQHFYQDFTSSQYCPWKNDVYPTRDDQGNILTTEYGLCVYKDRQIF